MNETKQQQQQKSQNPDVRGQAREPGAHPRGDEHARTPGVRSGSNKAAQAARAGLTATATRGEGARRDDRPGAAGARGRGGQRHARLSEQGAHPAARGATHTRVRHACRASATHARGRGERPATSRGEEATRGRRNIQTGSHHPSLLATSKQINTHTRTHAHTRMTDAQDAAGVCGHVLGGLHTGHGGQAGRRRVQESHSANGREDQRRRLRHGEIVR